MNGSWNLSLSSPSPFGRGRPEGPGEGVRRQVREPNLGMDMAILAKKRMRQSAETNPAAMAADSSQAAILSRTGTVLPWGKRSKDDFARQSLTY